jgi:hypothetical protein
MYFREDNDARRIGPWLLNICGQKDVLTISVKHDDKDSEITSEHDIGAYPGEIGTRLSVEKCSGESLKKCDPIVTKNTDNICVNSWVIWVNVDKNGHLSYLVKFEEGSVLTESLVNVASSEYKVSIVSERTP